MSEILGTNKQQQIKRRIYNYLKQGLCKRDSALMSGISEATYFRWIKEDESFESQVESSILKYKYSLIKNITKCSQKDGKLALDILSPSEWGVNATTEDHTPRQCPTQEVADTLQAILRGRDEDDEDKQEIISAT
jgi:hypothetical protein